MLYDKNRKNPSLDRELFKNPTAEYRGTPFWAWNCDLQKDELCRQIDDRKVQETGSNRDFGTTKAAKMYFSMSEPWKNAFALDETHTPAFR